MTNILCLGQFIIPLYCPTPISFPELPQRAFLQRGTSLVHVWCSATSQFGDLSQMESSYIGPLLGPIGSCSTPLSEDGIQPGDQSITKILAYLVTTSSTVPQLRGCIFSFSRKEQSIVKAFRNAQISLNPIWNYDPNIFYNTPHTTRHEANLVLDPRLFQTTRAHCRTTLKHHQAQALQFLINNESPERNNLKDF